MKKKSNTKGHEGFTKRHEDKRKLSNLILYQGETKAANGRAGIQPSMVFESNLFDGAKKVAKEQEMIRIL